MFTPMMLSGSAYCHLTQRVRHKPLGHRGADPHRGGKSSVNTCLLNCSTNWTTCTSIVLSKLSWMMSRQTSASYAWSLLRRRAVSCLCHAGTSCMKLACGISTNVQLECKDKQQSVHSAGFLSQGVLKKWQAFFQMKALRLTLE